MCICSIHKNIKYEELLRKGGAPELYTVEARASGARRATRVTRRDLITR